MIEITLCLLAGSDGYELFLEKAVLVGAIPRRREGVIVLESDFRVFSVDHAYRDGKLHTRVMANLNGTMNESALKELHSWGEKDGWQCELDARG